MLETVGDPIAPHPQRHRRQAQDERQDARERDQSSAEEWEGAMSHDAGILAGDCTAALCPAVSRSNTAFQAVSPQVENPWYIVTRAQLHLDPPNDELVLKRFVAFLKHQRQADFGFAVPGEVKVTRGEVKVTGEVKVRRSKGDANLNTRCPLLFLRFSHSFSAAFDGRSAMIE
jgi:hypothetical protein